MKILFVVDTLGAGGAERSLQELLPAFSAAGEQVVVACFHRRAEGVEDLVRSNHDLRVLSGSSRLAQMAELRRLVRQERIDLVHTTLFEADVFGRTAIAGCGVPIVTSLVNMPYEPARLEHDPNVNAHKLLAVRGLEVLTGLLADHFHAITEAVKDAAARHLYIPRRKITVIHRGRDPKRLGRRTEQRRREVRRALGVSDDAFVVLNAARREFQKGQRVLLEAVEKLEIDDLVLWIAGREGNASEQLASLARRPAIGRVTRFLGHRDDVPDLMAAADVFALPSLWEGLGCVVLEAMALELPVVASDLPPVREVVGDSALLVPPGDPGALAEAITRLARDRALADRLRSAARSRFENRFTLDQSAQAMLELFQRVAATRVVAPSPETS